MIKVLLTLFLFFTHALYANNIKNLNLTQEQKDFLKKHPTISVHMEKNYAPFSFTDSDKLTGFSIDYANLIAKKLGIKFIYTDETWDEAVTKLQEGKIDIIAQMINTKERQKFASFTEDYMTYFQSIVVKKSNSHLNTLNILKKKTVGVVKGYATVKPLQEYYPSIKIKMYPDTKTLIDAIISQEIDAAISTHQVVQYDIISRFITDVVSIPMLNNPYMPTVKEAFGVKKEFTILRDIINKTISALSTEKRELQTKWFGSNHTDSSLLKLSNSELEYLKNKKRLNICMDPAWMPFSSLKDGEPNGMSSDFLAYLTQYLKIDFKTVQAKNWTQVLQNAKNKKCDTIILLKNTKERQSYLNFTKPILSVPYVVATTKDKFFIDDFKDVKNKTFSAIKGSAIFDDLQSLYENIKLLPVDNIEDGLALVSNKKVYGYIDATAPIAYGVEKYGYLDLKVTGRLPLEYDLAIGIQKEETQLLEIINKIVETIDKNESERIYNKWITMQTKEVIDYSLVWQIIFVMIVITLLFIYRYKEIKRSNKLLKEAHHQIELQNKRLEYLATTDKLTNIYNRAKLDEIFQNEIDRSIRFGHTFVFCILDIDYFKSINDTYGHQIGDKVLIEFAKLLKQNIRKTDYVGRWGGEEFVIISPETNIDGAKIFFNHLQSKIRTSDFEQITNITASFGVTQFIANDTSDIMIKRADDALYKAKNSGRDTIEYL